MDRIKPAKQPAKIVKDPNKPKDFRPVKIEKQTILSSEDRDNEIFRQKIDLKKYDFSTATVKLVASVQGLYKGCDLNLFGIKRLQDLCKSDKYY